MYQICLHIKLNNVDTKFVLPINYYKIVMNLPEPHVADIYISTFV